MNNEIELIENRIKEKNKSSLLSLDVINTNCDFHHFGLHKTVAVFNNTINVKSRNGGYLQNAYRYILYDEFSIPFCNGNVIDFDCQKDINDAILYFKNKLIYLSDSIK